MIVEMKMTQTGYNSFARAEALRGIPDASR